MFTLSCESTVDLPYAYVSGRDIRVLFYSYTVDGKMYDDDMGRNPDALPQFYRMLSEHIPQTSQLNISQYIDYFEPLLEQGDVLHVAFGSGMSNSVNNAMQARNILMEKYPNRKLVVIDSYCSSSGYGLLVCRRGHQFYSTDLKYYRRSGRMSGPAATIASILNICPIMRLDWSGRIKAYDKVRGKKAALERTMTEMKAHAEGGLDYPGKCFVCHSNCLPEAEQTVAAIREHCLFLLEHASF